MQEVRVIQKNIKKYFISGVQIVKEYLVFCQQLNFLYLTLFKVNKQRTNWFSLGCAVGVFFLNSSLPAQTQNRAEVAAASVPVSVPEEEQQQILKMTEFLKVNRTFEQKQWINFFHLEKNFNGDKKSQILEKNFFLSQLNQENRNKINLEEEMYVTVNSLFKDHNAKEVESVLCRFPARVKFLYQQTKDFSIWKKVENSKCLQLNNYLQNLNPGSVSFVFSSYFSESPGSSFGHTFFRINKKSKASASRQELLDTGVSFAAEVTTENPFLYAFNGMFGGFQGRFTQVPYYFKVREYNDFESRDLWSYELNLTDEELDYLILHLWELGPFTYSYLFFTQNCSYHMLTVIEAAVPRLELIGSLPFYIIPVDSLKVILKNNDMVKKIDYRPSLKKTFELQYSKLSDQHKKLFLSYVRSKKLGVDFSALSEQQKAQLVDAVIDYVNLQDSKGVLKKKGDWYQFRNENLLLRSKINVISEESLKSLPLEESPEKAHESSRWDLGLNFKSFTHDLTPSNFQNGTQYDSKINLLFAVRLAFHDLLDKTKGLPKSSSLEAFQVQGMITSSQLQLKNILLFRLFQLNPVTELEKKISWSAEVGLDSIPACSQRDIEENRCLSFGIKTLFGYSAEIRQQFLWLMPLLEARYGDHFIDNYLQILYGFQLGVKLSITEDLRLMLISDFKINQYSKNTNNQKLQLRYSLSDKNSLELLFQSSKVFSSENLFHGNNNITEGNLVFQRYY